MAKALVEVIGDSASAVRAAEQTAAAFATTGDAAKKAAVDVDALAASMVKASSTRLDSLLAQSAALKQYAATSASGSTEQALANEAALKKQTQAYKLLGIQAAQTASITKTAGTIGRGLTTYVTAPTAFVGYEAVKQALAFNQALLLIRTQAGASESELRNMNSAVLQLVQSGHSYGQTAQGMAQSLYYVESEGIRGARALATIQAAAAGAAKGQTDMADTTNALTSAMKIWNVQADGAAKTMATIDAITASGKMHLQDLNAAFNTRFFSTAQAIGVPLEQAGALLDVFTKMGVPAESAATNLTTTFIRMVNPAKGAAGALQSLSLSTGQLGKDLQSGGITKALADLVAGYSQLEKAKGPAAAEAAVFGAFGGSHGGGAALQAIKGYQSYMQSLGEIQRLNNPATFWSQVSEAMDQPAMKIKQDVAEIGADFIKLGTALAPTVATIAGGIATISSDFAKLPGPVKDTIGVIVAGLAIGGPLGMAISGIGKLVGGLRAAFGLLAGSEVAIGPAAAAGTTMADAQLARMGIVASTTAGEVGTLRAALISLGSAEVLGPLAVLAGGLAALAYFSQNKTPYTRERNYRTPGGSSFPVIRNDRTGQQSVVTPRGLVPATGRFRDAATHPDVRGRHGGGHPVGEPDQRTARTHTTRTSNQPQPITQFALPQNLANEEAKARAGYGSLRKADEDIKRYILGLIQSGRLHGKAIQEAYDTLASVNAELASSVRKSAASAKKSVTEDQMYAQAKLDLANGEVAAARTLLEKDRQRLQAMLAEAQTSEQRLAITNQLAKVDKLLHTKSDQFQLSPRLQMEIARADALAAMNPSNSGPDAEQIRLAKQAKAQALKAIHSHTLTMQGLIQAWQIVQTENSVLASSMGMINTYHAVSSAAIDRGLGLTHQQDLALRERISQADAHRGYAPNPPGSQHSQHKVDVNVHVQSNDSHIIRVTQRHTRQTSQRAGGRR